jgi:hypothetical protein
MQKHKLLIIVIIFDFVIVLFHLILGHTHLFFNLDSEQNLPTIYQGAKLIVISTLIFTHIYLLAYAKNKFDWKPTLIWLPFYAIFLFLGIDELSQFHESFTKRVVAVGSEPIDYYVSFFDRLGFNSATWLLIYIPMFLLFIGYIYLFLRALLKNYRKETIFLGLGAIMFLFVPVLEYINTSGEFLGTAKYESLMILEETSEMIGATFFLYFSWAMLRKLPKSSNQLNSA